MKRKLCSPRKFTSPELEVTNENQRALATTVNGHLFEATRLGDLILFTIKTRPVKLKDLSAPNLSYRIEKSDCITLNLYLYFLSNRCIHIICFDLSSDSSNL